MQIDKDDDRYEPSITQSSFRPEQGMIQIPIKRREETIPEGYVKVVRCKDCKHYYALNEVRGNCSEYNFVEKIPIDYCSWAERKEE